MNTNSISTMTLIGALLIAEKLITQAQLDECLRLQERLYAGTPIGQILLKRGYISEENLARMVGKQRALRRALAQAVENCFETAFETAISAGETMSSKQSLPELGAFTHDEFEQMPAWAR